jgi:hypothetical protein
MLTDEDLQRELAAAFHAEADPVARTGIEPVARLGRATGHRRRCAALRAGAVTAAALAAAITVVVAVARPAPGPGAGASPAGLLLAAKVATAPSASAAAQGMPPFYVVADHNQPTAYVRDSASGRLLSTVRLPAGTDPKLTQVTAAGDDRTFVLALFSLARGTRFYVLRITGGGRSAGLTPLAIRPLPAREAVDSVALTPDGTRLAVAIQSGGRDGKIEVITLATSAVRTWTTTRDGDGLPENLSWDAAGRRLAFFWSGTTSANGLWLLDTSVPGGGLLSGQRLLPQAVGPDEVQSALINPSARTIMASVTYNGTMRVTRGTVVGGVVEVSAQTGRPLRTLLAQRAAHSSDAGWYVSSCLLPSIDATGHHLLVNCGKFGRLDRGRFTTLPGDAMAEGAAAW